MVLGHGGQISLIVVDTRRKLRLSYDSIIWIRIFISYLKTKNGEELPAHDLLQSLVNLLPDFFFGELSGGVQDG